ncbi:MAG: hypothetical protein AAF928_19105 [Myxococcota bacterium]
MRRFLPLAAAISLALALGLPLGLGACQPVRTKLEPAVAADRVGPSGYAARDVDQDFELTVAAAPWDGSALITQAVTPLRFELSNRGAVAAEVHLEGMRLVTGSGEVRHALPPLDVDGDVVTLENVPYGPATPVAADRFAAAGRYRGINSHLRRYNGAFRHDAPYYQRHFATWSAFESLPTPEMVQVALPEGVLEPGGRVSGWVYFERLEDLGATEPVFVEVELAARGAATSGAPAASFRVPFRRPRE